jgi:hypothetical protein
VIEARADGLQAHAIDLGYQAGQAPVSIAIALFTGQAGVLAQGRVKDRDRLRQRQRQVEEQRVLPGLAGGLQLQLGLSLDGGMQPAAKRPRAWSPPATGRLSPLSLARMQ